MIPVETLQKAVATKQARCGGEVLSGDKTTATDRKPEEDTERSSEDASVQALSVQRAGEADEDEVQALAVKREGEEDEDEAEAE